MPKNTAAELEQSSQEQEPKKKRSSKKKKPAEGSRWTALIILVGTCIAGLCFYWISGDTMLAAHSPKDSASSTSTKSPADGFFVSTYVIEK